jgi:hypothetical protein
MCVPHIAPVRPVAEQAILDESNGEMLGKSFEDMEQAWLIVPSMLDAMDDMVNASGIPDHP